MCKIFAFWREDHVADLTEQAMHDQNHTAPNVNGAAPGRKLERFQTSQVF